MSTYYHVSFEKVDMFVPRIPKYRTTNEDSKTPRICVCPSVKRCLMAMPEGGFALMGLRKLAKLHGRPPIFYIYSVEESAISDCMITPDVLYNEYGVVDALESGECWITKSVPFKETIVELSHCDFSDVFHDSKGAEGILIYDLECSPITPPILPMDRVIREIKKIKEYDIRIIYKLFAEEEVKCQ